MTRFLSTLILAAIIFLGGWLLYHRQNITSFTDVIQLARESLQSTEVLVVRDEKGVYQAADSSDAPSGQSAPDSPFLLPKHNQAVPPVNIPTSVDVQSQSFIRGEAVRVASFNLENKSGSINPVFLADICQRYDAIGLQNVSNSGTMSAVVAELRNRGLDYLFVDRKDRSQNLAILFNQESLILDGQHWYTVNDPAQAMSNAPLVAWFRARNAHPDRAFTFSLANVQFDGQRPDREIVFLGELFRAIRDDGRGEDDVIIAGDFNAGDRGLGYLREKTGLHCAIIGKSTDTDSTRQFDNVIFNNRATVEYTGISGVFDFMRQFNLSLEHAKSLSKRMPVWAEFSVIEGHSPGRAMER